MYQAVVRLFYIIHLLLSEFHNYMFIIKSPLGVGEETLKGSTAKALPVCPTPWGYTFTCTLEYHPDSGV